MALVDFSREIQGKLIDSYREALQEFFDELIPKRLVLTDYSRHRGIDIHLLSANLPDITFYPTVTQNAIISSIYRDNGQLNMGGKVLTRYAIAKNLAKQLGSVGLQASTTLLASKLPQIKQTYARALAHMSNSFKMSYSVQGRKATVNYTAPAVLRYEPDISALSDLVFSNATDDILAGFRHSRKKKVNIPKRTTVIKPKLRLPSIREDYPTLLSKLPDISSLNTILWQYVKRNMGTPRLNWRTGRLAKSYEITKLYETRKGIQVYFRYMNFPYREVFEPGGSMYKFNRSPTDLGRVSIRQLLVERFKIQAQIHAESLR